MLRQILGKHNETNKGEDIIIQVLDPPARQLFFMDLAMNTDDKTFLTRLLHEEVTTSNLTTTQPCFSGP
jgi:hypothetical protein